MHNLNPFIFVAGVVTLAIVAVTLILYCIIESQRNKLPKPLIVVRVPYLDPISEEDSLNPTMVEQVQRHLNSKIYNDYRFIVIESNYDAEEIKFEVLPFNTDPSQVYHMEEIKTHSQELLDSKMHFPKL